MLRPTLSSKSRRNLYPPVEIVHQYYTLEHMCHCSPIFQKDKICYAIYSMAFMIRAIIGPNAISCDKGRDGTEYLIQEGLENTWCIIVFLLMYFYRPVLCRMKLHLVL
jgi:hypothetical protein